MPQLNVTLHNRSYTLSCEPGEEARLYQLADYLDRRLTGIAKDLGDNVQETQLFMLTSLMLVDELAEAKSGDKPKDETTLIPENDNALEARVDALTARLEKIISKVAVE